MSQGSAPLRVSRATFARLIGVRPDTVSKYLADGLPHRGGGHGRAVEIDVAAGLRWWLARRPASEKDKAQTKYFEAQTRKLDMEHKIRSEQSVLLADVETRWLQMAGSFKAAVLNLVPILMQRGLVSPEQEPQLQRLVDDVLLKLSRTKATE